MAVDALDPGPNGDYPYFPRDAAGNPLWSDSDGTDGVRVNGVTPMPSGLRWQDSVRIDVTPRNPDGTRIVPPVWVPS